jgi:uncharacterized RDD family membrane protein YckC
VHPAHKGGRTVTSTPPAPTGFPPPDSGLEVPYAGRGARLVAFIIDWVIIGFIVGFFYVVGFNVLSGDVLWFSFSGSPIGVIVMVIGFVLGFFFKPWFWSHGGQTPGYKITRMQVIRATDGSDLSFGTAIVRMLGYILSAIVFYLGFIWILFDAKRQGWHDKIAGTLVISIG